MNYRIVSIGMRSQPCCWWAEVETGYGANVHTMLYSVVCDPHRIETEWHLDAHYGRGGYAIFETPIGSRDGGGKRVAAGPLRVALDDAAEAELDHRDNMRRIFAATARGFVS